MAKNYFHVFSVDLQPFEPAVFGDDVPLGLRRAMDRGKATDEAVGRNHSQNVKTLDDRAGVSHESLVTAALSRDMGVGGFKTDEVLMVEILHLRCRVANDRGQRG